MNNKDRKNFTKLTRSGISLIVLIVTIIVSKNSYMIDNKHN